ncbi:MAG: KGGVGR-motif variant AAA ATPase [Chloroflexota bacterium]
MLAVTFYSFRGGVGRTTLATNVAGMLAQAGQRVLLVDFDLEAPGLSYLEEVQPAEGRRMPRGVVGFLADSWEAGAAQSIDRYLYDLPDFDGRLAIMPAGDLSSGHFASDSSALREVDFFKAATQGNRARDGMTLFYDLRQQWERSFDYVLIDSRTGFTDVGGVCTRVLPGAVVVVMTLAQQARLGTRRVLEQIRGESVYGLNVSTAVVVSHVPQGLPFETNPQIQAIAEMLNVEPESILTVPLTLSLLIKEHPFYAREAPANDDLRTTYGRIRDLVRSWNEWDVEYAVERARKALIDQQDPSPTEALLARLMMQTGPIPAERTLRAVNHLAVLLGESPGSLDQRIRWSELAIAALRGIRSVSQRVLTDHAMTLNNLANALQNAPGDETLRAAHLKEAIQAYRDALVIWTRERFPVDHAITLNNLANALVDAPGDETTRAAHLKEAIQAYRTALEIFRDDNFPDYRRRVQKNLADAEARLPRTRTSRTT